MTNDPREQPRLTAKQVVEWKRRLGLLPEWFAPRNILLCYQSSAIRSACHGKRTRRVNGFTGEAYLLNRGRESVAVVRSAGPGAPAAVALLEELVALGGKRFISVGLAGAIQPALRPGDTVIVERAIRGEGTSPYYLPESKWIEADSVLSRSLQEALERPSRSARLGCTWTTDAPYREALSLVREYQVEGVDTVEMETAALFAAGRFLDVQVAAGHVVADLLDWRPSLDVDQDAVEKGLGDLVRAALDVLGEVP